VVRALRRLGLLPAAYRASSYVKMRREERRLPRQTAIHDDGYRLPPAELIYQTAGTASPVAYVESGRMTAASIRETLAANGVEVAALASALDFGCGCGRVVRAWAGTPNLDLHGCDYNPRLVAWCRRELPFATFTVNGLEPPLTCGAESFELIYAVSVFTHLPERLQDAWLADLRRVLRPGGLLLMTTHGARHFAVYAATPAERKAFASGELVVGYPEGAGSNLCAVYHPAPYLQQRLEPAWEIVDYRPEGDPGTGGQEIWLLRRPGITGTRGHFVTASAS
jgi:SAM-dependent methyltransferase